MGDDKWKKQADKTTEEKSKMEKDEDRSGSEKTETGQKGGKVSVIEDTSDLSEE